MKPLIEGYTPYRNSSLWRIHEAYYARRGIAAWSEGDIPYRPTSNGGVARQCAELLIDRFGAGAGEVTLLEVGGGNGAFAGQLLNVLDSGLGPAGHALFERLRYVFSDYSKSTMESVSSYPAHRRLIEMGRLTPALLDLRGGGRPRGLDGKEIAAKFDGVIANYVACVLPTVFIRKKGEEWSEQYVQLSLDPQEGTAPVTPPPATPDELVAAYHRGAFGFNLVKNLQVDYEWRPTALDAMFAAPIHAALLRAILGDGDGSLAYPFGFVDLLCRVSDWLSPSGFVLACDYGSPQPALNIPNLRPTIYGDSLNHALQFVVFDAFAEERGWGLLRTDDSLQAVQHVFLTPGAIGAPLREAFQRCYLDRTDGADLVDFVEAARLLKEKGDPMRAARFYARAVRIERHNARLNHETGQACIQAGRPEVAMSYLAACAQLNGPAQLDYEFQLGTAHYQLGQYEVALDWFRRSLKREPHVATHWNMALTYHAMGDVRLACRSLNAVLALEPGHEMANKLAGQIKDDWWQHALTKDD